MTGPSPVWWERQREGGTWTRSPGGFLVTQQEMLGADGLFDNAE
jgi:hypothetical protein